MLYVEIEHIELRSISCAHAYQWARVECPPPTQLIGIGGRIFEPMWTRWALRHGTRKTRHALRGEDKCMTEACAGAPKYIPKLMDGVTHGGHHEYAALTLVRWC